MTFVDIFGCAFVLVLGRTTLLKDWLAFFLIFGVALFFLDGVALGFQLLGALLLNHSLAFVFEALLAFLNIGCLAILLSHSLTLRHLDS